MDDMKGLLLIGFKGRNNLSCRLVEQLSRDYRLLTNSASGLKKDIGSVDPAYECVVLFGVDKNLPGTLRIEGRAEKDGEVCCSLLSLEKTADCFRDAGLTAEVSVTPTSWLCNEAYWHLLRKFSGRAVLVHIPTMKNADGGLIPKVQQALSAWETEAYTL